MALVIGWFAILAFFDLLAVEFWMRLIMKIDKFRTDKNSLSTLRKLFLGGIASALFTLLLYRFTDPIADSLFSIADFEIAAFYYHLLIVGPVEEFAKFALFVFITKKLNSIHEPLDAVIQAATIAIGFAAAENFKYGMNYGLDILLLRSVVTMLGHATLSSIWGFVYGTTIANRSAVHLNRQAFPSILIALVPAAFLHGVYNYFFDLNIPGVSWFVVGIEIAVTIIILIIVLRISPYRSRAPMGSKEAISQHIAALKLHPESYLLRKRLAVHFMRNWEFAKAEVLLFQALTIRPNAIQPHLLLGAIKIIFGNELEGCDAIKRAWERIDLSQRRRIYSAMIKLFDGHSEQQRIREAISVSYSDRNQ